MMGGTLGNQHGTLHAAGLWELYADRAAAKLYAGAEPVAGGCRHRRAL